MERNCAITMEGCNDGGKNSNRVANASEEEK